MVFVVVVGVKRDVDCHFGSITDRGRVYGHGLDIMVCPVTSHTK